MRTLIAVLLLFSLSGCSNKEEEPFEQLPPTENVPTTTHQMRIIVGNREFTATLESSNTAGSFAALLPLTLTMSELNSNEKYASLPHSLITAASRPSTIQSGDIMLYGSSTLVLFYETFANSYSYTRIGKVNNLVGFKEALGIGSVTVQFELE